MSLSHLAILVASIITVLIFCQFGVARHWVGALKAKPWAAVFILIWFCSVLLPTALGGDFNSGNLGGSRFVRMAIVIFLFLTACIGTLKYPKTLKLAGGPSYWMALYGLLAIASASYSVAPVISLWKGFEVLSFVLSGIYLSRYVTNLDDIQWVIDLICLILLYLIVSTLYGAVIAPSEAFPKMMVSSSMAFAANGVIPWLNANTLTQLSGMLFCLTLACLLSKQRRSGHAILWVVIIVSFMTLILGHSRTSIFGTVLAIITILIIGRHFIIAGLLSIIGSVGLLYGLSDFITAYIFRGQTEELFTSMSGRTVFWEMVWPAIIESPFFGHGFYSQRIIFGVASVDNSYLQVLVGLGFLGLIVFLTPIIITIYKLIKTRPTKGSSYKESTLWVQLTSLYILLLIRSLTGPTFQDFHINLILVMITIIATVALARNRSAIPTIERTDVYRGINNPSSRNSRVIYKSRGP